MTSDTPAPDPSIRSGAAAPDGWKNMEDFAAGIDTNRLPRTDRWAGTSVSLDLEDGERLTLDLTGSDAVVVHRDGAPPLVGWYEAVPVRDDVTFLTVTVQDRPMESAVVIIQASRGRGFVIDSVIAGGPTPGRPRVSQRFRGAVLTGAEPSGRPAEPSRDLIGLRALYRYSPEHLYEHVYLSSERYAWQCLQGAQRGHGDVDLTSTYALGDNLYVFTFREFVIPVAATWLYDFAALRSTGTFFGLEGDDQVACSPGGAHITVLGRVTYPEVDPV